MAWPQHLGHLQNKHKPMLWPRCSMVSLGAFILLLNKHHILNPPNLISNLKPHHKPQSNKLHNVYTMPQHLRHFQNKHKPMSRPRRGMATFLAFLLLLNRHYNLNRPNPISNLKPHHKPHSNKFHHVYTSKEYVLRQPIKIKCYSSTL